MDAWMDAWMDGAKMRLTDGGVLVTGADGFIGPHLVLRRGALIAVPSSTHSSDGSPDTNLKSTLDVVQAARGAPSGRLRRAGGMRCRPRPAWRRTWDGGS